MEQLILKPYHLETVIKVLSYSMPFQTGRIKNRFMTILMDKVRALEANRLEILTSLAEKGEDGKPLMTDNSYKVAEENQAKWQVEYQKLMTEDVLIDVTPSLKIDLGPIKAMINDSPVELDNQATAIMEEVMTALETSKPKAEKKSKK